MTRRGNLTSKSLPGETWTYSWNALNQLVSLSRNGALEASFQYDPLGRRVLKSTPTKATTYTYDGMDILRENVRVGGITTTSYYVHGPSIDEPLAKETAGVVTYYHADGLGSIVKETSAAGAVTASLRYDAWGNIEAGARDGFAFTGREWDPEMGLYYYRARYYDPRAGRFISEDPIGLVGGVNLYGYVNGNPARYRDPLGLYSTDEFLYDAAQFSAGFGDTITGGATSWVRGKVADGFGWQTPDLVDTCSATFQAGRWTGVAWEAAFAVAGAPPASNWKNWIKNPLRYERTQTTLSDAAFNRLGLAAVGYEEKARRVAGEGLLGLIRNASPVNLLKTMKDGPTPGGYLMVLAAGVKGAVDGACECRK